MPVRYRVGEGECIASIAYAAGFDPETIWNHPENAALRQKRTSLHVLQPGDEVFVPDRHSEARECGTGQVHRFRRKSVPDKLRVELRSEGVPRAGLRYLLEIDGVPVPGTIDGEGGTRVSGTTDEGGRIDHWISPAAGHARLRFEMGELFELELGGLAPVSEALGVRARLVNLGFLRGVDAPEEDVRHALVEFQRAKGLGDHGELDAATRNALLDEVGV